MVKVVGNIKNSITFRQILYSMETALLQYPVEKVFHRLQKILKKKGFIIISSNEMEGKIKAHKRRFLQNKLLLDINTSKIDEKATRVDVKIETHPGIFNKKLIEGKTNEEELWNSIYEAF